MFVTKVCTISCLLSVLTTNPTNAKHLLVEIKENVKKNDDYDEKKGNCNEVECLPVLQLLFLLPTSILYSSLVQVSVIPLEGNAQFLFKKSCNLLPLLGALRTHRSCVSASFLGTLLLRSSDRWRTL